MDPSETRLDSANREGGRGEHSESLESFIALIII